MVIPNCRDIDMGGCAAKRINNALQINVARV